MVLALFDFDGTVTHKDSMADFIIYCVGKKRFFWGLVMLTPVLLLYALKAIPNDVTKQKLLAHFFEGWPESKLNKLAKEYTVNGINRIIRNDAMERIQWHKERGHKVVIVSASMKQWLKGWAAKNELDLIATTLEVKDSKITGRFAGLNCYGAEKARRISTTYNLQKAEYIYAYGDSSGDKAMLALANEKYYRFFTN